MANIPRLGGVTFPSGPAYLKKVNYMAPALTETAGLVGLYLFGGDSDLSLRNIVNPNLPLTRIGNPVVNALGATCDINNCFDTGLSETQDFTFIAIGKPLVTGSAMLISNFGPAPVGSSLYFGSATTVNGAVSNASGTTAPGKTIATPVTTDWYQFSLQGGFAGGLTLADVTYRRNGAVATPQSGTGAAARSPSTRKLRIGGHYSAGSFVSPVQILLGAIWDNKLTDAKRNTTFTELDTFFTDQFGITSL